MGYTTDFIGHIEIRPRLNPAEQLYLTAFSASRRFDRPDGSYAVPANPYVERDERPVDIDRYNGPAPGQPSLWCGWVPCLDGSCLSHDGHEKFYGATAWLAYLIDHFLAPDAIASSSAQTQLADFTFDHVLDGTIAACRRDTRELYLIHVVRNVVSEQTLRPPDPQFFDVDPLPYELVLDEQQHRRRRRRDRKRR